MQPIKTGQELLFYYGNFCIDVRRWRGSNLGAMGRPRRVCHSPPSGPVCASAQDAVNMYGFAPSSAPQCKAAGAGKKLRKAKPKNSYAKAKPYAKASG